MHEFSRKRAKVIHRFGGLREKPRARVTGVPTVEAMTQHSHPSDRLAEFSRPDTLRVRFPSSTSRTTVAVTVVAVIGFVAWLFFSQPQPAVQPVAVAASVTADPAPAEIVVSVVGHVAKPGLVTLPAGARAAEALAQAEPYPDASIASINQAQKLVDGIQLVVAGPGTAPAGSGGSDLISLNQATSAELEELSGVGEKTAGAIIDYRDLIGGFTSIDQLQEVKGIGPATFAEIKDAVTL